MNSNSPSKYLNFISDTLFGLSRIPAYLLVVFASIHSNRKSSITLLTLCAKCLLPLLGGILFSAYSGAQENTALQESALFERVTTAYGELLSAQNVPVVMRDETVLAVDIYRPNDSARHAALYAAGPYPHSVDILDDSQTQAGNIAWYVSQGYAVVIANVRGTGASTGDFSFFSREEQQDHYEIIEWTAEQPWSDGQVAGTGAGYYAAAQWQMAIQNPPHLECIAPVNGTLDPFREWINPGGLANNTFINNWYDRKVRLANAYSSDSPRLVNYDLRLQQLTHQFDDDYWQIRNSLESTRQITVPVFIIHDWSLEKTDPGLQSTLFALNTLNAVNKILIRSPATDIPLTQDTEFLAREMMPFYDWCFNGRNSSSAFIEIPRIRYQVKGQNGVKRESSWPPGNIGHEAWFLNSTSSIGDGLTPTLTTTLDRQQQAGGIGVSTLTRAELGNNSQQTSIRFESAPLTENLELAGPVMLELYASSTSSDMAFEVTLSEEIIQQAPQAPDKGRAMPSFMAAAPEKTVEFIAETFPPVLVTSGSLKASARARKEAAGSEFLPLYSLSQRELLQPGQVYRMDMALRQTAYRFSAGNRLVLEIKPVNDGSMAEAISAEILQHNRRYPSRLWLPVVQSRQAAAQNPAPGNPALAPSNRVPVNQIPANRTLPDRNLPAPPTTEEPLEDTSQFFVPQ